jgi:hypothetical protein
VNWRRRSIVPCIDRRAWPLAVAASWLTACSSVSLNEPPAPAAGAPATATRALPPTPAARSWEQFRVQAAQRIVAANPGGTYLGTPPDILLAIPVLEVELNGDGSIRRIDVLRYPRQAPDTTQLAIDALRRAAPFGDVSRLPKPWKFTETFLFDDERKFKPRTLD